MQTMTVYFTTWGDDGDGTRFFEACGDEIVDISEDVADYLGAPMRGGRVMPENYREPAAIVRHRYAEKLKSEGIITKFVRLN